MSCRLLYRGWLILLVAFWASIAWAQNTIYVPDDYTSIQEAIDASAAGDTIWVAGSETPYSENIKLRDGITLEGEGPDTTTLQGDNYYHTVVMANNTTLRGFTILGNPSCVYSEADGVLVENNTLLGHYYDVQVEAGSIDIVNTKLEGAPPFIALYCANCTATIENCDILGAYVGMKLINSDVEVYRSLITGTDNGVNVETCSGSIFNSYILDNRFDGVHLEGSDGFILANNVVYGKGYDLVRGVFCHDCAPIIANNIISECRFGIMAGPDAEPIVLYNDLYNNADGNYVDFDGNGFVPSPGVGELHVDPLFVAPDDPDFRLADGSPCIDAGYTIEGYRDPDGSPTDIGAHGGPNSGWVGYTEPPRIRIWANQEVVGAEEEEPFVVSVGYTNRTNETVEVDRYVAVMADFGLFYLPWMSPTPRAERMFLEPSQTETTEDILSIEDTLTIPLGQYTFYAALARPGTFDFYSPMSSFVVQRVNKPVAKFTVTPTEGGIGEQFRFDASESYDIEDALVVLKVRWDWENNGVWDVGWTFKKTAHHSYSTPGVKTIKLEVRDLDGYIGSTTGQVTVTE